MTVILIWIGIGIILGMLLKIPFMGHRYRAMKYERQKMERLSEEFAKQYPKRPEDYFGAQSIITEGRLFRIGFNKRKYVNEREAEFIYSPKNMDQDEEKIVFDVRSREWFFVVARSSGWPRKGIQRLVKVKSMREIKMVFYALRGEELEELKETENDK